MRYRGTLAIALLLQCFAATGAPPAPTVAADRSLLFLQMLDQRIADISWRITSANKALCPQQMNAVGLSLHDAAQYAPAYRRKAIETFGFGDGLPAVLAVAVGGPADRAGVRPNDRIAVVGGQVLSPARLAANAKEDYAPIGAATGRFERLPDTQPVAIEVLRANKRMTLTLIPAITCRARVEVVPSAQINANSNGFVVQINGKLALWTKTDDELATIMAHEMAHNILDHNGRIDRERIGTGMSAIFGRNGAKLRQMEREADRYGLYMVERAGYDYRVAPDFWRRLTNTTGIGSVWATTHPTAKDRAEFNQRVVDEIDYKKAAGVDLVP